MPTDALAYVAADERRNHCSQVDAHVENRESTIAAWVIFAIELSDHYRDIRLEQTGADNNQKEPGIKARQRLQGHRKMSARDDDSANKNGESSPQQTVRQQSAKNICKVDGTGVHPIDASGL